MELTAKFDFVASFGGRPIDMKKGEAFKGTKADAERLQRIGFIGEEKSAPARKRKEDE